MQTGTDGEISFAPQILTSDISDKLRRLPSHSKVAQQHAPLLTQMMHTLSDLRYADDLAQSAKAALVQQQLGVFLTWLSSVYSPQNTLPDLPKQRWQAFCALLETHFSTQHQLAFYADALSCHEKNAESNLPAIRGANGKTVRQSKDFIRKQAIVGLYESIRQRDRVATRL